MTTPASAGSARARNATPGVVITPADRTEAPHAVAPAIKARSIVGPDSRVSRPITMSGWRPPVRSVRCRASDAPIVRTVFESNGNSPALARIPSVPNNFLFFSANFRSYDFQFRQVRLYQLLTRPATRNQSTKGIASATNFRLHSSTKMRHSQRRHFGVNSRNGLLLSRIQFTIRRFPRDAQIRGCGSSKRPPPSFLPPLDKLLNSVASDRARVFLGWREQTKSNRSLRKLQSLLRPNLR